MRFLSAFLGLFLAAGCGAGGFPNVIEAREIPSASGSPRISRVRDAGTGRVPSEGAWKGEEDGVATPGELLLIEGDNFGRQPTIAIGGRATGIIARTDGGGVIVRVPVGVPSGEVEVSVSQPHGRAVKTVRIRRLAVVVHAGLVHILEVGKDVKALGAPLSVPGARLVRLSSDGGVAYVIASRPDHDRLVVIDLGAAGGPKQVFERLLTHRATLLASAQDAPVVVAIGEGQATLFSTTLARSPAPYDPVELPKDVRTPRAVELSPDGKVLALLIAEGNKLAICDVEKQPSVKLVTTVDLLPSERLSLVRDLSFSSDGETLWVVSGDNDKSLPALQPTRLTAVRLMVEGKEGEGGASPVPAGTPMAGGARLLSVWRTQSVPGAAAPIRLAIARGQPLASGTTIRMPPDKAAVFVTSVNDALFKLADLALDTTAGAKSAIKLWHPPQPGMMVRADINGGGGPLFSTPQIMSAVDLTPDSQLVLATAAQLSPGPNDSVFSFEFGVTISSIWGSPSPTFLQLGPLSPSELKPPFAIGDLRIQP